MGSLTSEIRLSNSCVAAIVAHARAEAPRECCGMLVGSGVIVNEAAAARNIAMKPTRFLIDPQDHVDAIRRARQRGLDVLGFYHSHPHSSAVPSETDRAEASYPDHLYLIVGLASEAPEIRLFRLTGGNFLELAFVPVD
ncbi:MAG TPA: M67 family metallopeptidase [Vicinamibacterales bacterium]|nr:M67 family metallopeptidase [Vicinamibacterales bacterium]